MSRGRAPDVAVIGAGIVGAACALFLARSGARVELFERAFPAAGSTGAGEGNVLAWDKELHRELPLALRSATLWEELADGLSPDIEYDRKGSIVVAETDAELDAATERAAVLAQHGVRGSPLSADELRIEEPMTAPDLPGGVLYPDDAQVEPRLAATALVRAAAACGARARMGVSVDAVDRDRSGRAVALATDQGRVPVGAVVVAAGAWTTALLERCGLSVPIRPRKGQILVLERSATPVRRKLSEAGYVTAVESGEERLQVAMVVESTRSGTTLIGSSRELVGFDCDVDIDVAAAIARRAIRFYPPLAGLAVIRTYAGLRPFTPDHLPVIGPFAEAENVCVATGHEGAGIGLGPATGELVAAWHAGAPPPGLSLDWFSPDRFAEVAAE